MAGKGAGRMRDLGRRKLRTTLTIVGITIGIWSLVVFGSMANKINALVSGGSAYYAGKVSVSDRSGSMGGFASAPLAIADADAIRAISGVAAVVPDVTMLLSDASSGATMSIPPMISGRVAGSDLGHETFPLRYAQGRALTAADEGQQVTVLGSELARRLKAAPGDHVTIRDTSFEVVGVLEPTLTAPDETAMVPLTAAQSLFVAGLPPMVRAGLTPSEVVTTLTVYPAAGVDPDALAGRIRAALPDVATMTAKDFDAQVGSATAIFNAILVGIGLISLVVGGLSVVNTMAMSVAERTREIGIKRAIGGSRVRIVRDLVTEAGLIGLVGGLLGLILGALVVTVADELGRPSGNVLFELTTGTATTAVLFSTILGALAGLVPAIHAARLDPVTALRYE
ncbi:MAG TPA: ABC transporter permease [Candidatus Dormibacteraeota bacterium]|nr:ABC transporter permease [Candidatus Dormibacteraeota bacterium]